MTPNHNSMKNTDKIYSPSFISTYHKILENHMRTKLSENKFLKLFFITIKASKMLKIQQKFQCFRYSFSILSDFLRNGYLGKERSAHPSDFDIKRKLLFQ